MSEASGPEASGPEAAAPPSPVPLQVDFAHLVGTRLFVYGWVLGLRSAAVTTAWLTVGGNRFDLPVDSFAVRREDVSRHLQPPEAIGHDHGFLLLADLQDPPDDVQVVRIAVRDDAGLEWLSEWPLVAGEALAVGSLSAHERTLRPLIPNMSPAQIRMLATLGTPGPLALRSRDLDGADGPVGVDDGVLIAASGSLAPGWWVVVERSDEGSRAGQGALQAADGTAPAWTLTHLVTPPRVADDAAPADASASPVRVTFARFPRVPSSTVVWRTAGRPGKSSLRRLPAGDALAVRSAVASTWAELDADQRIDLLEALAAVTVDADDETLRHWVDAQLAAAVAALPLAFDLVQEERAVRLHFDMVVPVGKAGLFIVGWYHAASRLPVRVSAMTARGIVEIGATWARCPRPDVTQHLQSIGLDVREEPGFACLVPIDVPHERAYLAVQVGDAAPRRVKVPRPGYLQHPLQAVREVLSVLSPSRRDLRTVLDQHVGPAVAAVWAGRPRPTPGLLDRQFGAPVAKPTVSIIVPLFGRHDLVDVQLALMADDPDLDQAELIYAIDDPSIADAFLQRCAGLHEVHGLSFRVVDSGLNLGFAAVNNLAASVARAPRFLFLNSDVFPAAPGWLSSLLKVHRARPDTGVLGAKLLYEDGTVQHAGMTSRRHGPWQGLWTNHHPGKGLAAEALSGVADVESVTAACALIDAPLFRQLGGFDEDYIVGDFEDSDLCHRAREAGRVNRIAHDVALYHLERQSQNLVGQVSWRTSLTLYNCWRHDRRWAAALQEGA